MKEGRKKERRKERKKGRKEGRKEETIWVRHVSRYIVYVLEAYFVLNSEVIVKIVTLFLQTLTANAN
jgi:hypothetical protein